MLRSSFDEMFLFNSLVLCTTTALKMQMSGIKHVVSSHDLYVVAAFANIKNCKLQLIPFHPENNQYMKKTTIF